MGICKGQALPFLICELCKIKWDVEELTFHDALYRLYVTEGESMRKIAKMFKVSPSTVMKWLKEQGISKNKLKC